ncbi:CCA tRNA nucleotidyltransferase [Holophaga foetida]|uniref:CCA tRNA nucleotidyltransferase n=1 Tax=Holophaga foetida TaxID=35839 RepID=UPI00024752FD|nr:HD domain-containing protein [Holophaga foetida]
MIDAVRQLQAALGPESGLVLVGGAVRDRLLARGGGDWDLASALLPEVVTTRAQEAGLKVFPTGIQHGTVTVLAGGHPFEITTFRGDGDYLDGRHPVSVRLGVALEEDLARRDFTINAMALPVEALETSDWRDHILDPFGGRRDLEARCVRAVGDPLKRFAEDGLRPLRACRFAAQLDFTVEAATLAAIPERLEVARKVAVERVFVELTKLLTGPAADRGLELLERSGLLGLWLPELLPMVGLGQGMHHRLDAWGHTRATVMAVPPGAPFRWAALLHDTGKPGTRSEDEAGNLHFYGHEADSLLIAQALLQRLRASRALMGEVAAFIRHHGIHPSPDWSDGACRRLLRRLEEDRLPLEHWGAFRLGDQRAKGWGDDACLPQHQALMERLHCLAEAVPPLNAKALALDGRALMKLLGRPGGPWLGELQAHLLERLLEEPERNTPEGLEAWVRAWSAKP